MNPLDLFVNAEGDPRFGRIIAVVLISVIALVLVFKMIVVVGAGQSGVIFDPLGGGVKDSELGEGMHIIMPWQSVERYNVKLQEYTMSSVAGEGAVYRDDVIRCVTSEGLYLDLDMTVWFKVSAPNTSVIRQTIGRDGEYQSLVVRPAIRSAIREVISTHEAVEVYGEERDIVTGEVFDAVETALAGKNIEAYDVLLRDVTLPDQLTISIEAKKSAEQAAQQMVYELERENLEATRKVVEAVGISSANEIIAGSLSNEYLTWYWISNLDTHDSVMYVPVGDAGIPLFRDIGNDDISGGE